MRRGLAWIGLGWLIACGGEPAEEEAPVQMPDIEGAVWQVAVGGISVPDADDAFVDLLSIVFIRPIFLQTTDVTDTSMSVRIALGRIGVDPPEQDPCLVTVDLPEATITDLSMEMGPRDTWLHTPDGVQYGLKDLYITGAVAPDGERLTSVALQGILDVRQAEGFRNFGTAEEICEQAESLGVSCELCSDDAPYCVPLDVRGFSASRIDAEVIPVEEADPAYCSR